CSGVGATVELDKIPVPVPDPRYDVAESEQQISFEHWLKMYPGTGFVLTVENDEKGAECIEIFRDAGIEAAIVGEIDSSKKLKITNGKDTATVFDLDKEIITGITSKGRGE
ncbi:MAG: AIR synthase-related protein, partial [Euryarchaeota archaeon]|nr:AIR synthase-related protein [Euryarchaeota archaeon]